MSDRKPAKAVQGLFSQMQKMSKALVKGLMQWLLRTAIGLNQRRFRSPTAGFVLPTVILLLLVVSLTVGALVFRAYSRSAQVIGESQQRVIYNAATPAIDRARAKLETLFDATKDSRYPGGVPAENYMTGMLRNDGSYGVGALPGDDQYTIPDEERLNLDGITKTDEIDGEDNAWWYRTDTNGDSNPDATVVYSIVLQTPADTTAGVAGSGMVGTSERDKANGLLVRQGPLSNQLRGNCAIGQNSTASSASQGWFQDLSSTATLRKNFQVDALVIPDNINSSGTFTTLEMQQDRKLDRGNKWGAWFRYDMEIFPFFKFNWNGAMHTEGNLMVKPNAVFDAYLVSSQASCLMSSPSNSEITVTNIVNPTNDTTKPPDFIGLALEGSIRDNNYGHVADIKIHVWPATTTPAKPSQTVNLDNSANGGSATTTSPVAQIALDPVKLLTEDVSQARGTDPPTPAANTNRDDFRDDWKGLPNTGTPRIFNQPEAKPYVDDLYRADDRWGPKPRYSDQLVLKSPNKIGDLITTNVTELINGTVVASNPSTAANVGLDGYWERRAFNEGMRVIVGQRLELGNANGWLGTNDPLYPPNATTLTHAARQRRTLRDNIAAVQATAVYHKDNTPATFPVACLASTAHPGTAATLAKSITFQQQSVNGNAQVITDFLTGNGTNGWEFTAPQDTAANFETAINLATSPLRKALGNLANFAGELDGAFPPKQEASGSTTVHPYPFTSMWGNFSELRRTLSRLDGGTPYANLSLADQTNLHTAACTLGMLAYNMNGFTNAPTGYDYTANAGSGSASLSVLGNRLYDLIDGLQNNGEVKDPATGAYFPFTVANGNQSPAYYDPANGAAAKYNQLPPEAFIQALLTDPNINGLSNSDKLSLATIARTVYGKQQVDRDRALGFKIGAPAPPLNSSGTWKDKGEKFPVKVNNTEVLFPTGCDPETFPLNSGAANAQAEQRVGLALAFCENTPRYPALFYLFPKVSHDYNGDPSITSPGYTTNTAQPTNEPYPNDSTIAASTFNYQVVGATADILSDIALKPKAFDFITDSIATPVWKLPNSAPLNLAANVSPNIIIAGTTARAVGFLDRAIFNGREMMTTRTMDIDLGMLRSRGIAAGKPWLPISGIVYAFREDAVREDAIARPAGGVSVVTNATETASPVDPTNTINANGVAISTKQVDYIADPDRRPHAFRLRNGIQLKRNDSFALADTDNTRGLSFFTDNPVYIQGNFNLHKVGADDAAGTTVEEFDEVLVPGQGDDGLYTETQFYGRTTRSTKFAKVGANGERWRPTEILADAISILSNTFCDGSIEDTFVAGANSGGTVSDGSKYNQPATATAVTYGLFGPGCSNGGQTSFLNQNRPKTNLGATGWRREDKTSSSTSGSPIQLDRNGSPLKANGNAYTGTGSETYDAFSDAKSLMTANSVATTTSDTTGTTVDAIIVSGIVPSRAGQSYGGLHNFPRFLESWSGKNLWYAGSFLQLNFSNSATAPYDQDNWEPPLVLPAPAAEAFAYFAFAPNRIWGYDPALQLAPAGPAAARFITAGKNRNEFYTELPANDPYIRNLCTAARAAAATTGVPANMNCPA